MKINIKLIIFAIKDNKLCVFLRNNTLPTVKLDQTINLEKSIKQLFENSLKTPIDNYYFEQLYTISLEKKEEIDIVYFVLINNSHNDNWQEIAKIKTEDEEIISYALQRLQWKIEYTNVVYSLLPKEFTLSELQKTYEAILGKILDKRNFRKKILSLDFLHQTEKRKIGAARPAQMYAFKKRELVIIKIF